MRRLWIILIVTLMTISTTAQDSVWSVWLFDAGAGQAVQVESTGIVLNDLILPIPAAYDTYTLASNIAISPDGTRIAYSVAGLTSDDVAISSFLMFDTTLDRLAFTYDTPNYATVTSLTFSDVAWNSTGNIVAFGYAEGNTEETQSWQVLVLNAVDGRILSELDDASPYFARQTDLLAPFLLPVLQFYGEATLGFNLIPYQTASFSADFLSYEWDIVTGQIIQTNRAPRITGDTLQATGESISPIIDERTNYDAEYEPYTNALHVYRPEVGARAPFFATQTYDLLSAQFVQNGDQVVTYVEDLLSLERTHLLVSRIGILRGLPILNAINNRLVGTPDGFAYVIDNQTPFLLHVNTRDGSNTQIPIWGAPENSRFIPVWATSAPQTEYDAWIQLAPLTFPSQVIVTSNTNGINPDAVPTTVGIGDTTGVITVDSVAAINTTGGDRLNMRDAVGLNSTVIARVESGVRVVVTDGPVAADGFIWWQIRLSTGQVGWVVEQAEGVQTLIPAR